ncbi:histidine phosphatase family protein [Cytobacillus oceanisediminis]|uniref:Broad specificity phosphatase PhoE n=1 Tax=Cytobacillus oceanisediminis TaxID=665099 RepID=A0A562K7L5_9BACI|nr:phosphoglycerate mutase family protein [Cytobacillus oceanisediminis]TWH91233.1 broad specificity phosphatase PhoE [Cytobacillus oceanisediminis]
MEITLIRHGRSAHIEETRMTISDFNEWIEKYNSNGIFKNEVCAQEATEIVKFAPFLITSDLKRSIESARLLNPAAKIKEDPLFRETELPLPAGSLMEFKLKPNSWAVMLRILWFCGYSSDCESYQDAKLRAKNAALKLISCAKEHNSAILVGHGFFNLLIAKELQKMDWKGSRKTGSRHWNVTTYKK